MNKLTHMIFILFMGNIHNMNETQLKSLNIFSKKDIKKIIAENEARQVTRPPAPTPQYKSKRK